MLFISNAFAQGEIPAEPNFIANLIPLVLIFGIFYFLLIRPQHKKLKAHDAMVKGLTRGTEIVTSGGILGKITKTDDSNHILHVEIAPGVTVRINRSTVTEAHGKKENKDDKKNSDSNKKGNKKKK